MNDICLGIPSRSLVTNLAVFSLLLGLCVTGLTDRIYDFTGGNLALNKPLRVFILLSLLTYCLQTGVNPLRLGFSFGIVITLFLSMVVVYSVFLNNPADAIAAFSKASLWCLGAISSYRLRLFGHFTDSILSKTLWLAVPVSCLSSLSVSFSGVLHTSQNVGAYGLLWFAPLLLLLPKDKQFQKSFLLFWIMITLMLVLKRGAIIAFVVGMLIFGVVNVNLSEDTKSKVKGILSAVAVIFVGIMMVSVLYESLYERFFIASTDRDMLYTLLFRHWWDADLINFVFGFGLNSVNVYTAYYFKSSGLYAHSDWFQMMHDHGLFGLILMCILYVAFIRLVVRCKKLGHRYAPVMCGAFSMLVCINIYSGQLFTPNTLFFGILLGVVCAEINLKEKIVVRA